MLNTYLRHGDLADPRLILAASALAPATLRVGGITGDWIRYVDGSSGPPSAAPLGYWPSAPENMTHAEFTTLSSFAHASGFHLMFMLSELYGRNCSNPVPGCPSCDPVWCTGAWDMSNVHAFLQFLHDGALLQPGDSLELGNELVGHLPALTVTTDILALADMIDAVWSDAPAASRPRLYAPSTDACSNAEQLAIMANITGHPRVAGFSYHAYPGESGEGANALPSILLNSTWLREEILRASASYECLDAWQAGPRAAGLELLVTESSSSWNLPLPAPAQNSFLNGFFTVAELGQYARTGVSLVARWAFAEPSPFGTLIYNATAGQWDAAADFFVLRAHKATVGGRVLELSGDAGSAVLAYAYCGAAGNGSVVIAAANPGSEDAELALPGVAAAPRAEWVLAAPGGNLSSTTPTLNGGAPLRLATDGTPPDMPPAYIAEGQTLSLPARTQAFYLLLDAALPACM